MKNDYSAKKFLNNYKFIQALKSLPFVEEIILYGSRARGDFKELSDIDLAIVCPKASIQDWLKVVDIIEEADTLLKIDCVQLDQLSKSNLLQKNIMEEGIVIYSKGN